jgi:hypothetical protein
VVFLGNHISTQQKATIHALTGRKSRRKVQAQLEVGTMHRTVGGFLLLIFLSLQVQASARLEQAGFPAQIDNGEQPLLLRNQSVLTYLWLDVYAAAFYSPQNISPRQAMAERSDRHLELFYFRDIDRDDVIKAAWITLERQHDPSQLQLLRPEVDRLHAAFRDIRAGDRYALRYRQQGLSLLRNGEEVFHSENPQLADAYLGIWLAPDGLSDSLRSTLLAGG